MDRFLEKYAFQTPFSYAASNPLKFIDVNGDSIKVTEPNQQYFKEDLEAAFGDKASDFEFSKNGTLQFNGNRKEYKGDEKKALKGLLAVNKQKKIHTYINYGEKIGGTNIEVGSHGGGITLLGSENNMRANVIYLLPNSPGSIEYIEFSAGFPSKTVPNNRSTSLFHELGHVLFDGQDQSKVIDFENTARSIQKVRGPNGTFTLSPLQKRTIDMTHNPSQITIRN